jgi:hypothetical protein
MSCKGEPESERAAVYRLQFSAILQGCRGRVPDASPNSKSLSGKWGAGQEARGRDRDRGKQASSGMEGEGAQFEGGGGGDGGEAEGGRESREQGTVEQNEAGGVGGLGLDGLSEGDGVVGVYVARGGGRDGGELDLLDGAIGVEDGGGDGVIGAGAPGQKRPGDGGDRWVWVQEDALEEGDLLAIVGGNGAVGEAWGVEGFARAGGEKGTQKIESDCGGYRACGKSSGRMMGEKVGYPVGEPGGGEECEGGVGGEDVVGESGLDEREEGKGDEGEDGEGSQGAEARIAEGVDEGDGVEQDEGGG